jgi:hypothetical protein
MVAAVASRAVERANAYRRRRPETTALYEVVRDNLETLYGAIDDGALRGAGLWAGDAGSAGRAAVRGRGGCR